MKAFTRRAGWLIATLALAFGALTSAQAQTKKPIAVALLTFGNSSGYGGALLGARASASVEAAMLASGSFDIVKRDLVTKTMGDLGLSYPLGRTGILQLAQAIEADSIVTGDVLKVTKDPKTSQVNVTLRLEMTDKSSGELVNGAIVSAQSGIRPDYSGSEDVLLDEALSKASFAGVRSMNDRILPEGTVFSTSTNEGVTEVLLNIGSNSGVRSGMELIALRNKEQVGRMRVTSVTPTDSLAIVTTTTRGVQPEDKVRAIFRLENIPLDQGGSGSGSGGTSIKRKSVNVTNVLVGALALFGLFRLTQGKTGTSSPGASGATALISGPDNGAPTESPAAHIKWKKPKGIADVDILGYFVWRADTDGSGKPIDLAEGSSTDTWDKGTGGIFSYATDPASPFDVADAHVNGMEPGVATRYGIRMIWLKHTTDSAGAVTDTLESGIPDFTNPVTAVLTPPAVSSTATNVQAAQFTFKQVPGGDRYVIQVSTSSGFTTADTYPKGDDGFFFALPPNPGVPYTYFGTPTVIGTTTVCVPDSAVDTLCGFDPRTDSTYSPQQTVTINLQTGNIDPTDPAQTLYWRVGVRSSRDSGRPDNGGWLWGPVQTVNRGTTSAQAVALPTTPVVTPPTTGASRVPPLGGRHRIVVPQ